MDLGRRAVLGIGACMGLLAIGSTAHALTTVVVDECLSAQIKLFAKGAAAATACYAKTAANGVPVESACLDKAETKVGPPFDKLETKDTCLVEGSGATRTTNAASFAALVDATVGHAARKCDAAKTLAVGKYVAAVIHCYAKAAAKTGMVDSACVAKARGKLDGAVAKAEAQSDCSHTQQDLVLANAAGSYLESETCALEPGAPGCVLCGNGLSDPSEPCDETASSSLWNQCSSEFTCAGCTCACPTTVVFSSDATAPQSRVAIGWTGLGHDMPFTTNGDVTLHVSNCAGTSRPCGTCDVSGPLANPEAGAGQLDSQRCSTNSAKKCTSDAVCAARTCLGGSSDGAACSADSDCLGGGMCPPAGVCSFYAGSSFPLSTGGISHCIVSQFAAPISGTANVESGEASTTVLLTARVYAAFSIDSPCPRCTDAGGVNDGVNGGSCDFGPRVGLACDSNGTIPGRPDYGPVSLDCPPNPAGLLVTLPIDLSNATGPVAKTLTPASPNCSGSLGDKCLCDTCNNINAEPCTENADCPDPSGPIGPICGGRRCLGGPNVGQACTATSECPGPAPCQRPGQPTQPSSCTDDTSLPIPPTTECQDPDGDGEGECVLGPKNQTCTLASGHAQRGCNSDDDCGGGAQSCSAAANRKCFPTGGGTFQPSGHNDGTDTVLAIGMEDAPMADVSHPTLGTVFCVAPSGSSATNYVLGLPGPARAVVEGRAVASP